MTISGKVSVIGNSVSGSVSSSVNISGDISKAQSVYIKELHFASRFYFPSIGEDDKLYIATDENAIFIFDTTQNVYRCIGRDYNEIGSIQCQLKED